MDLSLFILRAVKGHHAWVGVSQSLPQPRDVAVTEDAPGSGDEAAALRRLALNTARLKT